MLRDKAAGRVGVDVFVAAKDPYGAVVSTIKPRTTQTKTSLLFKRNYRTPTRSNH
jgi:hypothetical protein